MRVKRLYQSGWQAEQAKDGGRGQAPQISLHIRIPEQDQPSQKLEETEGPTDQS